MLLKFFKIYLLFFCVAACAQAPASGELRKLTLWTSWKQQAQFAGVYIAKEKGYYKEIGLDVEIAARAPRSDIMTALLENKVDIVLVTLPEAIIFHDQNPDFVSFGQICQHSSLGLVTLKKDGITSVSQLNGKRLAAWPGPIFTNTDIFLKFHNVKPEIIFSPNAEELLLWEVVQACTVMHYHEYYLMLLNGVQDKDMNVFYLKDHGLDMPEDGLFCLRSKFADDPELLKKFNRATMRGWKEAFDDEEKTLEIVRKYTIPFSKSVQTWMLHDLKSSILSTQRTPGILSRESYDMVSGLLLKFGKIKKIPKFEDFYLGPAGDNG